MNKKRLFDHPPKRIFTFGCSFTNYIWPTWADILAYDLGCTYYNLGKSGAGNQFISTMITLADLEYKFTKDDLVIIEWTNIAREDRYSNGWHTPGNIYSQTTHDKKWVKQWADPDHYALRDYSYITLVREYLKNKTNYHMTAMINLKETNQYITKYANGGNSKTIIGRKPTKVRNFDKIINKELLPSFYKILWGGTLDKKYRNNFELFDYEADPHPLPIEHLKYLQTVFDHEFSKNTISKVEEINSDLVETIRSLKGTDPETFQRTIHNKYHNTLLQPVNIYDKLFYY